MKYQELELLAPAANSDIAIEAILHGADAVYMGATSHGARKAAANSLDSIAKVVDFAHQYRAKVYVTVNTIVYENELKKVEELCSDLYHIGVDALIVQDMGILRMKIPPIAVHASTQCDIRTPEKARFLQDVGFSQLVLARELTLAEIKAITDEVEIPVECFIHGALCVSYSGRCHASLALTGRSANRGECAQICRLPFTLKDSTGKKIVENKYLLSLKDFNASHKLEDLINAGVSSFKIEGRLKDASYVKNITAFYNLKLNQFIERSPEYKRSSYGKINLNFEPNPDKSFNRGFTDYFLSERKPMQIASLLTPKSQGEKIKSVAELNNGDGISFYDNYGNFTGVNINKIENSRIVPARKVAIPKNAQLYRTLDMKWEKLMSSKTAERKIGFEVELDSTGVTARDEMGNQVRIPFQCEEEIARTHQDYRNIFSKTGNTIFGLKSFHSDIPNNIFIPNSRLTEIRRTLLDKLQRDNTIRYPFNYRKPENPDAIYPVKILDYRDNVANSLAEQFYLEHGVKEIESSSETRNDKLRDKVVMTTRHCILRELGFCKKDSSTRTDWEYTCCQIKDLKGYKFPLFLHHDKGKFKLRFNCNRCEMEILN